MNQLMNAMENMLKAEDEAEKREAEHRFIEVLTFSNSDEIIEMLNSALSNDFIGFPVWARNLAFRLITLLEPSNVDIRRRAAADLRTFGPDWDSEADRLDEEANRIESKQKQD